jgi:hypothetical protein
MRQRPNSNPSKVTVNPCEMLLPSATESTPHRSPSESSRRDTLGALGRESTALQNEKSVLAPWPGAEFNEAAEIEATPKHAGLVWRYDRDFPTREQICIGHGGSIIARVAGRKPGRAARTHRTDRQTFRATAVPRCGCKCGTIAGAVDSTLARSSRPAAQSRK